MKKTIASVIFILLISLALVGCGGGSKGPTKIGENAPITGPVTEGEIEYEDGTKVNFGTAKSGEGMELPADFPVDVLPLLDDAEINFVNINDANNGIGITFVTAKSFDQAVAFYKEVMTDGQINMETQQDNMYMVAGAKGAYSVIITITHQAGHKVNILLDATPKSN